MLFLLSLIPLRQRVLKTDWERPGPDTRRGLPAGQRPRGPSLCEPQGAGTRHGDGKQHRGGRVARPRPAEGQRPAGDGGGGRAAPGRASAHLRAPFQVTLMEPDCPAVSTQAGRRRSPHDAEFWQILRNNSLGQGFSLRKAKCKLLRDLWASRPPRLEQQGAGTGLPGLRPGRSTH